MGTSTETDGDPLIDSMMRSAFEWYGRRLAGDKLSGVTCAQLVQRGRDALCTRVLGKETTRICTQDDLAKILAEAGMVESYRPAEELIRGLMTCHTPYGDQEMHVERVDWTEKDNPRYRIRMLPTPASSGVTIGINGRNF